jgi:vacuolar-type H+-ATPase subunit I/STV1
VFGVYLTKVKCTLNVDNNLSILKNKMSKITRKIELIPDIENLTHEESNQRCYKVFYNIDNKLYKVANLLVCQLFGLDNLLSLMRLQNDEYVKCQSKLASKSISEETKRDIKKRMEAIDKELLARKDEIAPKHPQTFPMVTTIT